MKILIADDSKASRLFLRATLQGVLDFDAEFFFAQDGEEAASVYKLFQPDLTFLDLTMPKKNGMLVLQEILQSNSHAKVVIVTADAQKVSHDKALQLGAVDYICKPISAEKISRKLHVWL